MIRRLNRLVLAGLLPLLLPACAHRERAVAELPPPPPVMAPPSPPAGLVASLVLPETNSDGSFRTINSGLTPAEAVWHLRGALNVAALACRGADQAALVAAYNRMLKDQKVALAVANKATQARFRSTYGDGWQPQHDAAMTRLYNFFAQPFAQARFCASAATIVQAARAAPAGQMEAFAVTALAALEAPFTDFYRDAAAYRRDFALWRAGREPTTPRLVPDFTGFDQVAAATTR